MNIDLIQIVLIIVIASLAWFANEKLNTVPILKAILQVIIVVVAVLELLRSLGIMTYGIHNLIR